MKAFIILAVLVSAAVAQYAPTQDIPIPYSFSYNSNMDDGGSSSHQESGDGSGRVTGSYTVNDLEGHTRVVDYIADEGGFRATIRTNEPGTASQNPADVTIESTAGAGGAAAYGGGSYGYGAAPVARPVARPVAPATGGRGSTRYVLVPVNDPRASGYY